jgi:hypothetical protein
MDINLYILLGIIFVALVVPFMVEAIKVPIKGVCKFAGVKDKASPLLSPFFSIIFGIGLCILACCDLFVAFGYPLTVPYVGCVAAGLVASLGAGRVYEIWESFRDYKAKISGGEKVQ